MITVVGNLKGGSGKSTVVFNLAIWLGVQGRSVKLLDLDPQRTLTDLVALRAEEGYVPELELLPSGTDLSGLSDDTAEVLIDVGASNYQAMVESLRLADSVLVPVVPGQADVWSTQRYLKLVQHERRPECRILLFMNRTDALGGSKETKEAFSALNMLKGVTVLPTRLGQRVSLCRSLSEGLAVFELDPRAKATHEFFELAAAILAAR